MRSLSIAFALPLSVSPLTVACQKVSPPGVEPCALTTIHMVSYCGAAAAPRHVPWIAAIPRSLGIVGFLFYVRPDTTGDGTAMHTHGTMPDGGTTKILWIVNKKSARSMLTVTGKNLTNDGSMRQSFRASGGGYPSIIDIPSPGYWQLTIRNGKIKGNFTLRILD